ncbi:hypothetical protein BGZ65_001592 [Modicella reniformis]|uniref:Arrestin C-terminal-like domain-containing protein n=1 Tax=Modicella reniformis TaxID=1440133 RepID=A0A9P6MIW9_9FUNG|nr:hypothetical protein BGZ65_001592 [Modicella reniformis]
MFMPPVPIAVPVARPVSSVNSAAASSAAIAASLSSAPTHETSVQVVLDAPYSSTPSCLQTGIINASVESKVGVCIGETVPMVLRIANKTHVDLHSIHLALVRQISYAKRSTTDTISLPSSPQQNGVGHHPMRSEYTYTPPESTTIHSATVPIAKLSNAGSTWSQQLQFRLPASVVGQLIPTIGRSVTPLVKIDYFVLISIPIPSQRLNRRLVSRWTAGSRKRTQLDLSVFEGSSPSTATPITPAITSKNPSALQFTPMPIVIGTVPFNPSKWPIPCYLDVTDRPLFVRDRFEEEMMQHFSNLESLMMEDEDDDDDVNDVTDCPGYDDEVESERGYGDDKSESKISALSDRLQDKGLIH